MKFNFETTSNFKINIRIWPGSTRSLFSASLNYGSHSLLMNKSKLFARLLILTQNKKNSTSTIYLQLPFVIGSFARPAWPGTILNLSHYNLVMHPPPLYIPFFETRKSRLWSTSVPPLTLFY